MEDGTKGDPLHEEGMKGQYKRQAKNPPYTESPMDRDQFALFRHQEKSVSHVVHAPNED